MRTLAIAVVLVFSVGCSCALEKKSIDQVESNLKRQQVDHKALMQQVGRVPEEQKDWDRHYEATFHLLDAMKKSVK